MAKRLVPSVGTKGIVYDTPPIYLPAAFWTNGRNIRFVDSKVVQMGGVAASGVELDNIAWVDLFNNGVDKYYLYSDTDKVYSYNGVSPADITRVVGGDYTGTLDQLFDLENFNGVGILNNGVDLPQLWSGATASTALIDLTNWTSTHRARTIRGFKNFLIAFDVLKTSTRYPNMVKWSTPADPGAVPASWDHTDPTLDAGETSLSDTEYGNIVNAMTIGQSMAIYKEGSIWLMSYVGGLKIFDFNPVPKKVGLKIRRSLCTIPPSRGRGETHFFADEDSFYLFNGASCEPVFDEIFKREIAAIADADNFKRSFSVVNSRENELWFCIPESGSEICTLAFVWNYRNDTYTVRELSGTLSCASGLSFFVDTTLEADLSHSDETLFADDVGYYIEVELVSNWVVIEASYTNDELFYADIGVYDYDGTSYWSCFIEREGLGAVGTDRQGEIEVDYNVRKLVTTIIPKQASSLTVTVGTQEDDRAAVSWRDPVAYDVSYKMDLPEPVSGRLLSFIFSSVPGVPFQIAGFDYELDVTGEA